MKRLIVSIFDPLLCDYFLINGKNLSFEKDKSSNRFVAVYETSSDVVSISLDEFHPYIQPKWWGRNILIFFLSFFGIFAPHRIPTCIFRFKGKLHLDMDTTNINVKWGWKDVCLEFEGPQPAVEYNERFADPRIKKRRRGLRWSKFGFIVLFVALLILILSATVK